MTATKNTSKRKRHPGLLPKSGKAFDFEHLIYEKYDGRAKITLNRPEVYNAFNLKTFQELVRAIEDASWDDGVGVLIITGSGDKAFCTGADLKEQHAYFMEYPRDYWKWMGGFIDFHEKLRNLGKPSIARLNGIVVGGGNELNMACDLAVAADDIYIRQVGAAHGSVAAGGATQWLPLIVGDRRAREILLLCEEIPAPKALEWGLVNQVVPREKLDETVEAMADKLLNKLPECTRYTKQQINFWRDFSWSMTVQHARDWLTIHSGALETKEAVSAYVEKRKPDYKGLRKRLLED
ncbi:MAG: enoyl-CoA hydratase/isomerase family protein [Vampirovibrionales bacterium]|nr:enoyl-CoA hydratase/isomerase family protein [Vampirovibrionales bacterium]